MKAIKHRARCYLLLAAISLHACLASAESHDACRLDLEAIPPFLAENDPGIRDLIAQKGDIALNGALHKAREAATQAVDSASCQMVLNQYLRQLRKGHLAVTTETSGSAPPMAANKPAREPKIEHLSAQTVLLTLPSFEHQYAPLIDNLLKVNHEELAARPNWIIDVRDNNGGSDSSYGALIPWLVPDQRVEVGVEWLATPANIEALAQICQRQAFGGNCQKQIEPLASRLRSARPGDYVQMNEKSPTGFNYWRVKTPEPRRPLRVAVLIDQACGSSCEQFLLAVRQSFSVKLIGRRTFGALDYSNLFAHQLPSGERSLWYATSRSRRLPHIAVDISGVVPDIYLPAPENEAEKSAEIIRIQHWLEGGSLNPEER